MIKPFAWSELRIHNGTQHSAFEELCCQLASREAVPAGSVFRRLGTPDGGVEGYHQYPNGDEWGFQAKFIQILGDSQLGQMDSSVKRALQTHPKLTRLTICVPINLADPRGLDVSATDRWNKRVVKWQRWAADLGRDVIFDKWGDHEIGYRLTNAEHRGRLYYWFNKEVLSQDWFEQRAEVSVADAGDRYTPELHVGLPISDFFEALGRTPRFSSVFRKLKGALLRSTQQLRNAPVPRSAEVTKANLIIAAEAFVNNLDSTEFEHPVIIGRDTLSQMAESILEQGRRLRNELEDKTPPKKEDDQKYPFANAQHELNNLSRATYQIQDRLGDLEVEVANSRCLLVRGPAGAGKTHLLADVNLSRIRRGLPSVLILGQKFTDRDPLTQIVELLQFPGTADELLGALNAAAEAVGAHATILIDALNEGAGRSLWLKHLAGLLVAFRAYPRLCVALSVRSTYEFDVIPPTVREQVVSVEHLGFGEKTFEAVTRFFSSYSIKLPGTPLATTEFANPLFLKLFCQGLNKRGISEVPVGHEGITKIFAFFLEAVEAELKRGPACKERVSKPLIRPYLNRLAAAMAENAETWIEVPDAEALSLECATTMEGSEALVYHLIRAGVLAKEMVYTGQNDPLEVIRFAYERVGDHALAAFILADAEEAQIREWFAANGKIGKRLQGDSAFRLRGFVEAAMIQVPESFDFELIELLTWAEGYDRTLVEDAFLHSMVWRRTEAFTNATWDAVNMLQQTTPEAFINVWLVIATRRGHAFNAEYLHSRLLKMSIADRDLGWTVIINRSYEEGTATDLLTRWARSFLDSQILDSESARLLAITLTWFLASTHQILRDRATKSLARVFVSKPSVVPQLLSDFSSCNDPYVLERLYAAAYGASMLIDDIEVLQEWALTVRTQMTLGSFPVSLLTRDYARGVVERAAATGVPLSDEILSSIRPPYGSSRPRNVPKAASYAANARFEKGMSAGARVEAHIYDQSTYDFQERYFGAPSLNVDMFSQVRLSDPLPTHPEKMLKAFEQRITGELMASYADSKDLLAHLRLLKMLPSASRPRIGGKRATDARIKGWITEISDEIAHVLPENERSEYQRCIVPYLCRTRAWPEIKQMQTELVRRWVTHRTLQLGWTKERFGDHDGSCLLMRENGTGESPRGLISHKYRWIAYDEFLARAADNFHLTNRWRHETGVYEGPWQFGLRDLDPSVIHLGVPSTESENTNFDFLNSGESGKDWLAITDDLPSVESIVRSEDLEWITLEDCPAWSEPLRPEEELGYRGTYREVRYWIHGYFVRTADADEVCSFLKNVRFSNLNMPDGGDLRDIFFGELYWSPAWKSRIAPESGWDYEDWTQRSNPPLPRPVVATCWSYNAPESDKSFDGSAYSAVPAPWFAKAANLRWSGHLADWVDAKDVVVVRDPTLQSGGKSRLEVRRTFLESFLAKESLELIWTFQGEKIIRDSGDYPYTELTGCYRYIPGGCISGEASNLGDARQ